VRSHPLSETAALSSPFFGSLQQAERFEYEGVKYDRPRFPIPFVNKSGERLRTSDQNDDDLQVIGNWRSSHAFPLLTFRTTLGRRGRSIEPKVIISQRLKRLTSIAAKLNRFRNLRLTAIQDIGGCRAVLSSERRARALFQAYLNDTNLKHDPLWHKNYVDEPKASGYRSFHLIYGYKGRNPVYDDLRIEIQIRSAAQHAWATAVETVDIFTKQALKSSAGQPEWDEFFRLMASFIALRERKACVPNTPSNRTVLKSRIREYEHDLQVLRRLRDFRQIAEEFDTEYASITHEPKPGYFTLQIRPTERMIYIGAYKKQELERAEQTYLDIERDILLEHTDADAVLVSVDKLINLKKAYPNYYGDTDVFMGILKKALA
jgi:hypothetical protein